MNVFARKFRVEAYYYAALVNNIICGRNKEFLSWVTFIRGRYGTDLIVKFRHIITEVVYSVNGNERILYRSYDGIGYAFYHKKYSFHDTHRTFVAKDNDYSVSQELHVKVPVLAPYFRLNPALCPDIPYPIEFNYSIFHSFSKNKWLSAQMCAIATKLNETYSTVMDYRYNMIHVGVIVVTQLDKEFGIIWNHKSKVFSSFSKFWNYLRNNQFMLTPKSAAAKKALSQREVIPVRKHPRRTRKIKMNET